MQCVEKGLLELDAPIAKILPEWESPDILTGFDPEGKPTMRKARTPITLRMLLSHSSGMSYAMMDPILIQYCKATGRDPMSAREGVEQDYFHPLLYEPGAGWMYSCAIDWAGKMVERVNNRISLGGYMKANIFNVLGMTSTTFHPNESRDISARLCGRPMRGPDGKLSATGAPDMHGDTKEDFGGGGLFTCASDYVKVLTSLLLDDGKLLKPETAKELFAPSLPANKALNEVMNGPFRAALAPGMPPDGVEFNYSLGGCLAVNGVPDQGEKNLLFWSGAPNSQWVSLAFSFLLLSPLLVWDDPGADLCLLVHRSWAWRRRLLCDAGVPSW